MRRYLAAFLAIVALIGTGVPAAAWIARGEPTTTRIDFQKYEPAGTSWLAYLSPWCSLSDATLIVGTNVNDSVAIKPSSFPSNAVISWSYPNTPVSCGVGGYMALHWGNYETGDTPGVAVTPRQVNNITTMLEEFDYTLGGNTTYYNLLNEFYLTSASGNAAAKVLEVGFMLHPDGTWWFHNNDGTWLDAPGAPYVDKFGRSWSLRLHDGGAFADYVTIAPSAGGTIYKGQLDMKEFLLHLKALGTITGTEWVNGLAFGVEMTQGSGSLSIKRLAMSWN